jgi:hypothetical protein
MVQAVKGFLQAVLADADIVRDVHERPHLVLRTAAYVAGLLRFFLVLIGFMVYIRLPGIYDFFKFVVIMFQTYFLHTWAAPHPVYSFIIRGRARKCQYSFHVMQLFSAFTVTISCH